VIDFDSIAIAITSTQLGAIKATESSVLTSPVVRPWPPKAPFCECVIFATDVQWDKYSDATQIENIYEISKGTSATRKQGA